VVSVVAPPPKQQPNPIFYTLPAGTDLIRLFDPSRYDAQPLTFRYFGPKMRFDHHIPDVKGAPVDNPNRAVYYSGFTLSCCMVEIFGDGGVEFAQWNVAYPYATRDLILLDIRHNGAMRAGTVAAIAKVYHELAQQWSRFFYERIDLYTNCDGVVYSNAHNDEDAILLYERADGALDCSRTVRLDDKRLRKEVLLTMYNNNMYFVNPDGV
jgi:hypothetical protein